MIKKLSKNMKFDLDKDGDFLQHIRVSLEWNGEEYMKQVNGRRPPKFDADLSIAMLQLVGKDEAGEGVLNIYAEDEAFLAYYGNIAENEETYTTPNGEIFHSGDCRTGHEGEEADIYFDKMPEKVDEISIVGTIHRGTERGQNWGNLNAKLLITNMDTDEIIAEYDLSRDVANSTAIHVGSFYKDADGHWTFMAIGKGYESGSLKDFIEVWTQVPVSPL